MKFTILLFNYNRLFFPTVYTFSKLTLFLLGIGASSKATDSCLFMQVVWPEHERMQKELSDVVWLDGTRSQEELIEVILKEVAKAKAAIGAAT
jgi:hypothetical protein